MHVKGYVNPQRYDNGQWVKIGSMATGRFRCLVVSPSPEKIIIVGGKVSRFESVDIVEECIVTQ